ncbi:MAG: ACP S-malonyltransferase [Paracoccaceae bacterium]|nr:ACP S-malonyltransferase [Paracoccaceae bacterium]
MKRAVLVCPGRGTYNAPELGSLTRHFPDRDLLARFDDMRAEAGQDTLTALDTADTFDPKRHTRGDNASALIYAAGYGDLRSLDPEKVEIVAVTGNSMGWYTALACAGAVSPEAGFTIANTMGTLMQAALIGGQVVYPHMADDWVPDPAAKAGLLDRVAEIDARADHRLALSIDLGGMLVLAGDDAGLTAFERAVPKQGAFPMRLTNHAAFHTDLMQPVSLQGLERVDPHLFDQPEKPLIDGRGQIWWPHATDVDALRAYTLGTQVTTAYDFTAAIRIAAREFAPDLFIVTGPGTTLGGAVAQSLILANWRGLNNKSDFQEMQARDPILVSMGRADQRPLVT